MPDYFRVFVEKRIDHANCMKSELVETLGLQNLSEIRTINIYELTGVDSRQIDTIKALIFSEIPSDVILEEVPGERHQFAVEYLPGQFDQRADSAAQCIQLIYPDWSGSVRSSQLFIVKGHITDSDFARIKLYCINPIESREKDLSDKSIFHLGTEAADISVLTDFNKDKPDNLRRSMELAMSIEDIRHCQNYFRKTENRAPTETEIRVLDTYWSDHCRHTTFETELIEITLPEDRFRETLVRTLEHYKSLRSRCGRENRPLTLMDMATISARRQRLEGLLEDLEVSEEINACSVEIDVDVDGRAEPWLMMFKNETHNHPTEIEPFGGASTCLGGAIRDPLSGRSYVYQAMRITGASDPTEAVEKTLPGKLPQRCITKTAARGYSSYGNQVGLATSFVREIYDPGYKAKRMELGAVVGAVPKYMVRRELPIAGDAIILIGGRTGRDGCGGATGSSKEHTHESLRTCNAEVQKGNAPEERKIQRLFRNPKVTQLIKKCNDLGAGGISVAIGELCPGLIANLDRMPTKYQGLSGTDLAISESQERMAVLVSMEDKEKLIQLAESENLEASHVADVTNDNRFVLKWRDRKIVDLDRDFLDTNGVRPMASVSLPAINWEKTPFTDDSEPTQETMKRIVSGLNVCSQKGLVEMFDASIGAATVQMPYGGKYQLSESEASIHKLPVQHGRTMTCSLLAYGFDPAISKWSPYHGSIYAVISSLARLVVSGGRWRKARLSLQEYFKRLGKDPENWGLPAAALLGALSVQEELDIPAIGGKDSMSGTFHDLHVPPTLISFAVTTSRIEHIVSSEFKNPGNTVYYLKVEMDEFHLPHWNRLKHGFDLVEALIHKRKIKSASTVKEGGIASQIFKMAIGNGIGFDWKGKNIPLFDRGKGDILFESDDANLTDEYPELQVLGQTIEEKELRFSQFTIALDDALRFWKKPLDHVFKDDPDILSAENCNLALYKSQTVWQSGLFAGVPQVFIPVFPGSNCEYDTERAFKDAGAATLISVFCNRNRADILASLDAMVQGIQTSQILVLAGGFSAGDEPDGSGKFIANVLLSPLVSEAIATFLDRDGLILGICNGFQALIKSGLLPYGRIGKLNSDSPTLAKNINDRHISRMVTTRVQSTHSPWLQNMNTGDLHTIAISHGEGRFSAKSYILKELEKNGQIAFQYCDDEGYSSMNPRFNPNGSDLAIEGITSPCGKILGKMGHTERYSSNNFINIPGKKYQALFESGIKYFE